MWKKIYKRKKNASGFLVKCVIMQHFLFTLIIIAFVNGEICPNKCICKLSVQRDGREWIKLKCGETIKIDNFEEIDLLNIANDVVQL